MRICLRCYFTKAYFSPTTTPTSKANYVLLKLLCKYGVLNTSMLATTSYSRPVLRVATAVAMCLPPKRHVPLSRTVPRLKTPQLTPTCYAPEQWSKTPFTFHNSISIGETVVIAYTRPEPPQYLNYKWKYDFSNSDIQFRLELNWSPTNRGSSNYSDYSRGQF